MSEKKKYDFGEKTKEYSAKHGKELDVWKSPKYEEAKKKVISMLESDEYKDILNESDFWILMNATKNEKMQYTGLIITHNACLKLNDKLPAKLKFKPECVSFVYDEDVHGMKTYNQSLIFIYNSARMENDEQNIFEIGEVSPLNCNSPYPYAMALKRCMDRVILKNTKLGYSGIYSDSEIDDAQENNDTPKEINTPNEEPKKEEKIILATEKQLLLIQDLYLGRVEQLKEILAKLGKKKIAELTIQEASEIISKEKK